MHFLFSVRCMGLTLIALLSFVDLHAQAIINLDPGVTHQTMSGWEVTAFIASPNEPALPHMKDRILDMAVQDIGINRVRLEVRSGVENTVDSWQEFADAGFPEPNDPLYLRWRHNRYATVNDNADTSINWDGFHFSELDWTVENIVLPLRERLAAQGEELYVNLCYVAFTNQIANGVYIHHNPEEYAEFVLATYLHLQSEYGIVPDAWELVLEPDNVPEWDGAALGAAMVAASGRLLTHGFTPRFIGPSNTSMARAIQYFDDMVAVPGALEYLDEFCYHRYGGVSLQNLQAIAARARQHNLSTSMLEWWFRNSNYRVLHEDVKIGGNSAWQGEPISGLFDLNVDDPANPHIAINIVTQFNRQYYRSIRSGAVRIEAVSSEVAFDPLAFMNSDGRYAVVVQADRGGAISIENLPEAIYGISYTTNAEHDVTLDDVLLQSGNALETAIPAAGVIAITAQGNSTGVMNDRFSHTLKVHPQPGDGFLLFTINEKAVPFSTVTLELYDVKGQRVWQESGRDSFLVRRGNLASGVYSYRLLHNGTVVTAGTVVFR